MRQQNHALSIAGIPKMKSQASAASDPEILQSQIRPHTQNRLSINALAVVHERRGKPDASADSTQRHHVLDQTLRTDAGGYCISGPPRPPCSAICELNGESPCFGSSTTTMVPIFTRL